MARSLANLRLTAKAEIDEFLKRKTSEKGFRPFLNPFRKWLSVHLYDVFILFFMIITITIIILFGDNLKKNVVDLLVGISAIGTVFLMYLTFKETKRTNDLKISEIEFDRFQRKIDSLTSKFNSIELISDEDSKFINEELGEFPLNLAKIKFIRFSELLSELKKLVEKQPEYIECLEFLREKTVVTIEDPLFVDRIPKLTRALKIIESSLSGVEIETFGLLYLFNEIEESSLNETQKKVLILRIWEFAYDFICLYQSYKDKDYFLNNVIQLAILSVEEGNLLVRTDVYFTSLIVTSRVPYKMCNKYLMPNIKF